MKRLLILIVSTFCVAAIKAQVAIASVSSEWVSLNRSESVNKKDKMQQAKEMFKWNTQDASYQSRESFISDFGNIPDVEWRRGAFFDEASFVKNGITYTAFYDYDALLVGTISDKTFEDLPVTAQKLIDKKYPGFTVEAVKFFDDNEANETDMNLYGKQFEDEDNYFVELKNDSTAIVLQVDPEGHIYFFKALN